MLRTQARFPEVGPEDGHYESFYIKAVRPGGGEAIWIRHTIHKRPDRPASCAVWFTYFDAQAKGPRATKVQYGADQMAVPRGGYIQVHSSELLDGRAHGSVHTDELQATWDLNFSDDHEPFFHLPREFLYRTKLPKTKFLSPYPNALFNGRVTVDGELLPIERWRGMIGHNWGREHAERWVWVQGAGFEGRSEDDYFDMAVGRIKVGRLTTPWVGNAMLWLDGEPHRLGGFEHVPSTKVDEQPTGCRFGLKGKGIKVTGKVGSEAKNFVGWVYADPVGPEHNTLNCSISDLQLEARRDGGPPERLAVKGSAAYEFGTRDLDHGIPLQPYPDG
ncbi:MAG: hypothetical protein ACXWES_00065 [Solirubrobacterales bacterium]